MDSPRAMESLEHLATTGCNYVAIVVTWYQEKYNSNHIYPINRPFQMVDPHTQTWNYTFISETPNAVVRAIRKARALGMKVMLKPHIDLVEDNHMWRGSIMATAGWWTSYRRMILFWARVAEKEGVEMLSMSCELMGVSLDERSWRKLIKETRKVYKGLLTDAANYAFLPEGGELTDKRWWDAVDYIGCDEYLPLPTETTVEKVKEAWKPIVAQYKALHDKFNRSVILTEVGYCSAKSCSPTGHATPAGEKDQAIHYEALLQVLQENAEWFKGVFWWNWVSDSAFGEGDGSNSCMDPKWKAAEDVLRRYYNATQPQPERDHKKKAKCICTL